MGSFIVSALFLSSCQDIDLLPKDNMPDELFWKTPDDFEKEVNWLYTRTETFGTKDTDSDIAYELNENTTSNGTLIAPNTDALWDSTFIDLRQSNMIIEKSQTYEGDPSEIERGGTCNPRRCLGVESEGCLVCRDVGEVSPAPFGLSAVVATSDRCRYKSDR